MSCGQCAFGRFDEDQNLLLRAVDQMCIRDRDCAVSRGEITFDHVWFKYRPQAAEFVLSDISFTVGAGQTVGIIGKTGSAKTTLVQMIPRLYDASRGEVRIDGRPVKSYPLRHLRDAVAVVLQKNTLFSGCLVYTSRCV